MLQHGSVWYTQTMSRIELGGGEPQPSKTPGLDKYLNEILDTPLDLYALAAAEKDEAIFDVGLAGEIFEALGGVKSKGQEEVQERVVKRRRLLQFLIERTGGNSTIRNTLKLIQPEDWGGLDSESLWWAIDSLVTYVVERWTKDRRNMKKITEIEDDPQYQEEKSHPVLKEGWSLDDYMGTEIMARRKNYLGK